ncbi:MAG: CotH kinase family protein [Saprospiraceae bacterium]
MIISGEERRSTKRRFSTSLWKKIGLAVVVLIGLIWAIVAYVQRENRVFPGKVVCDSEKIEGKYFVTDGIKFKGGDTQSKDWAFTGKYSCKVWKKRRFGITYSVYNPKAGERYKARVWVHRPKGWDGYLVGTSPDGETLRVGTTEAKQKHLEWELFEIIVNVPPNYDFNRIDFYVYTDGQTIYFDDFSIEKIEVKDLDYEMEVLNLNIADKWMKKIIAKRKAAMGLGILISADDDWVKGEIEGKDKSKTNVELRLKGDWLDHLRTDKWSYRIKVSGEESWNRMKTFSIQQPGARNFLDEWLFHKLLEKVDVLTPRYEFVQVVQNGVNKGIYAYEEHFEKQLVEYKKRREGPIVKFREDLLWLNIRREMEMYTNDEGLYNRPFTDPQKASQIAPFKEKKTKKSSTLAQQYEQAQTLMQQYRYGKKTADEIFDIDAMAKYFAVCDIMAAYHGIAWHNQRFYYNPVTSKLEPIGFDGFSAGHEMSWMGRKFMAQGTYNQNFKDESILGIIFKNEKFMEKYTEYLYTYSSREFFEGFLEEMEDEILIREAMLKQEYPKATFDFAKFHAIARNIRAIIEPYNEHTVQAHTESETTTKKTVKVTNFHALPMRVVGFGNTEKVITDTLRKQPLLQCNIKKQLPTYLEMTTKPGMKYIFFELPGKDSIFTSPISLWKAPDGETALQQIFNQPTLENTEAYQVIEKRVIFNPGKFTITKDIIIPEDYRVVFPAGVELNFIKKAKFVSKSPIVMIGTENQPITIKSTDFSANGFTVLQAEETSKMAYVTFDGFNTLVTNGWNLTGAVTFYESDINMTKCRFIKNKCEDGLNIVRAKLDINGLTIGETFSDGLDIDFGTGTIKNAYFYKTGNDGMDFSGSNLTIVNAVIKNAGDKGVSVGEESTVYIKKVEIDGANIGVASKDLSKLVIEFVGLKDCNQGFIAFQKKPEYGGAKIVINNYKAENIRFLHKIQEGSTLQLKGKDVDNS